MNEQDYKYDVAFSFLQEDEVLAQRLNDLLKGRVSTFIYTERQKELAGTDGEQTFGSVFGQEARIVVILHRPTWGTTKWTRIEETAIRNRGYEEGYDFAVLVPVGEQAEPPKWFPKNRIWVGLERWGLEAAAAVIEARLQEAGGAPREEMAEDQAARLSRQMARDQKVREFLGSAAGVKRAEEEVQALFAETERICTSITSVGNKASVEVQRQPNQPRQCTISNYYGYKVRVWWENEVCNTLSCSALRLEMTRMGMLGRQQTRLAYETFKFDGSGPDDVGWRRDSEDNRRLSTKQMADYCVKMLLDAVEQETPWLQR